MITSKKRSWLGVLFRCCSIYSRVYKMDKQNCYRGQCPGCGKWVKFIIGPGGTGERFFMAD